MAGVVYLNKERDLILRSGCNKRFKDSECNKLMTNTTTETQILKYYGPVNDRVMEVMEDLSLL